MNMWMVSFHYFIFVLLLADLKDRKKILTMFSTKLIEHIRFMQSMKKQYHPRITSCTHLLFRKN